IEIAADFALAAAVVSVADRAAGDEALLRVLQIFVGWFEWIFFGACAVWDGEVSRRARHQFLERGWLFGGAEPVGDQQAAVDQRTNDNGAKNSENPSPAGHGFLYSS